LALSITFFLFHIILFFIYFLDKRGSVHERSPKQKPNALKNLTVLRFIVSE